MVALPEIKTRLAKIMEAPFRQHPPAGEQKVIGPLLLPRRANEVHVPVTTSSIDLKEMEK